jgi:hypothetical protein
MIRAFLLTTSLVALMTGCTHLQSLSLTQIPAKRSQPVSAESERLIILGLNFDNDYTLSIPDQLASKCPEGTVRGILTRQELINYFLGLVVKSRVVAKGYCVKA